MKEKIQIRNKNKEAGITLVALIITIILLIILSAATIKSVWDSGLIALVENAALKYTIAQAEEKEELDRIEEMLKNDLGDAEGAIRFGELQWSNEKASVTISKKEENEYKIEYKILDNEGNKIKEYQEIENGGRVGELELGYTVVARLKNETQMGTKYTKGTASITVVDNKKPESATIIYVSKTANTITVTANGIDNESGIASYRFEYKLNTEEEWHIADTVPTGENKTLNYTYNVETGKTYNLRVIAIDRAGNEETSEEVKNIALNNAPILGEVKYNTKTTDTITVTTSAEDKDGDDLTYTIYTSENEDGIYEAKGTASGKSKETVTLIATGLSQYTNYYYYVEVSDSIAKDVSEKANQKTYCPGSGFTCNSGYTERCTSGYSEYCSGGSSTTCRGGRNESCQGGSSTMCQGGSFIACQPTAVKCPGPVSGTGTCSHGNSGGHTYMSCPHGQSSKHTVKTNCSHGYSSSHIIETACSHGYYESHKVIIKCSHGYSSSHTITTTCSHGKTSSHTISRSCSHGYTSSHTISYRCSHGKTSSHSYCSHQKTGQHDD